MLSRLIKWIGKNITKIYRAMQAFDRVTRFEQAKKNGLVTVGKHTYGIPEIVSFPGDRNKVTIGPYCSIAEGVTIFAGGNHRVDWITTYPIRLMFKLVDRPEEGAVASKGDVVIGPDVWIGYGATIMSGVEIGPGAVIGARAVVARSVPPYAVVAGNPARVIRKRFPDEQIKKLLEIKWWDWPEEQVLEHVDLLCSRAVEAFCEQHQVNAKPAGCCRFFYTSLKAGREEREKGP